MSRKLKSISQFAADTSFTEAQLRWWIFNEKTNGMSGHKAVVRIGRRVYIDPEAFDRWIDSMQAVAA